MINKLSNNTKHIYRFDSRDNKKLSWCVQLLNENDWFFQTAEHAANSGLLKQETRACENCKNKIIECINNGWD